MPMTNVIKKLDEVGALMDMFPCSILIRTAGAARNHHFSVPRSQWFISWRKTSAKKTLACINEVKWIPSWGRDRIYGMVENRPTGVFRARDYVVCRLLFFICGKCKNEVLTQENSGSSGGTGGKRRRGCLV